MSNNFQNHLEMMNVFTFASIAYFESSQILGYVHADLFLSADLPQRCGIIMVVSVVATTHNRHNQTVGCLAQTGNSGRIRILQIHSGVIKDRAKSTITSFGVIHGEVYRKSFERFGTKLSSQGRVKEVLCRSCLSL